MIIVIQMGSGNNKRQFLCAYLCIKIYNAKPLMKKINIF